MRRIRLIGDKPHIKHGENSCRSFLAEELNALDFSSSLTYKLDFSSLNLNCDIVIIFPGSSFRATVIELFMCLYFLLNRKPTIVWFHNASIQRWKFVSALFSDAPNFIMLTLLKSQNLFLTGRSEHFPNGIKASSAPSAEKKKRLFWLGRLDKAKGIEFALCIFKELHRRDSEWEFHIYGPEGDFHAPTPSSNLHYFGPVWNDEKFSALSTGGILIFPSKYPNETQPLVIIEAFSVGLPVVVSNINGIDEMITYDSLKGGEVVQAKASVEDYVSATIRVFNEWERYSADAQHIFHSVFSSKAFRSRLKRILNEITQITPT